MSDSSLIVVMKFTDVLILELFYKIPRIGKGLRAPSLSISKFLELNISTSSSNSIFEKNLKVQDQNPVKHIRWSVFRKIVRG